MKQMRTIFVADDDQLMREMLSRFLSRRGFQVRTFASATALLERFEFEFPHLILSDINMPGMTGLELAAGLRHAGSEVPVMLMTAEPNPGIDDQLATLRVHRIIEKPIRDMDVFLADIHAAMGEMLDDREVPGLDDVQMRFLTALAHDLRTPLTSVKAALDNLLASRELTPDEQRMAEISRRNLNRVTGVIEKRLRNLQDAYRKVGLEPTQYEEKEEEPETPEPAPSH